MGEGLVVLVGGAPAPHALQLPLAVEVVEVTADRRLGDVEPGREVADGCPALLPDEGEDRGAPLLGQHD